MNIYIINGDSFSTLLGGLCCIIIAIIYSFIQIYQKRIYKWTSLIYVILSLLIFIDGVMVLFWKTTNLSNIYDLPRWGAFPLWKEGMVIYGLLFTMALYYQWNVLRKFHEDMSIQARKICQKIMSILALAVIIGHIGVYMILFGSSGIFVG